MTFVFQYTSALGASRTTNRNYEASVIRLVERGYLKTDALRKIECKPLCASRRRHGYKSSQFPKTAPVQLGKIGEHQIVLSALVGMPTYR